MQRKIEKKIKAKWRMKETIINEAYKVHAEKETEMKKRVALIVY